MQQYQIGILYPGAMGISLAASAQRSGHIVAYPGVLVAVQPPISAPLPMAWSIATHWLRYLLHARLSSVSAHH